MLELTGKHAGEYLVIVCATYGEETDNEDLGYDPAVPHFKTVFPLTPTDGSTSFRGLPTEFAVFKAGAGAGGKQKRPWGDTADE